ncbi:MAG: hypothetical protein GWN58_13615 [Anaerolineae bacterium]|nr:hypothetical protein [Anaerolineae bacterium]
MKVFVSTTEQQERRANDFCFVPEGELVTFALECDGEAVDGPCGCRRSMSGAECGKATTTFQVVDRDISEDELVQALYDSYERGGWVKLCGEDEAKDYAKADAAEIMRLAAEFPEHVVLEKRGNSIQTRTV